MNPGESFPRLDPDKLRAALSPSATVGREILVFEETDSTNDLARRAGRRWHRRRVGDLCRNPTRWPRHTGPTLDVAAVPGIVVFRLTAADATVPVSRWPELTFCAALAVAETAELATGQPARIKWPNDVLLDGRKVAGILVECHHRQHPGFVVIGIGLNVLQQPGDFDPELRDRAASLAMVSRVIAPIERHRVAGSVLGRMEEYYRRWPGEFPALMDECRKRGCVEPA